MLHLIKSPVLRQYVAVIFANLTIVQLGMHITWASPILIKLRAENQTILNSPPTLQEEGWIVSVNQLAGAAALLFTGTLVSLFGRKRLMVITVVPRMVMCFLCIFATEVWMILLGRAIGGVADMMCLSAVATYAAEVAGKKIRGASGTATQIMSATGMMIMFSVGPYVSYLAVNVMMICILVVVYIPILFIPESPYFLYARGRTQDAIEVLTLLRGNEQEAHEEIKDYATAQKGDTKVDAKSLLKDKVMIKSFVLVILLSIGFNLIGYNAVNFYLQTIFELAQTSISSEISSLIVGVIQLLACLCTFFLTDRFGRKPILCISLIGLGIGMVGLGTFFVLFENGHEITGFLNFLPLLSVIVVIYGFNAGMGSLLWIVVAEIFDGPVRPYGVSCGILVGNLSSFALTFSFPILVDSVGSAVLYYFFSVCNVGVCLIIYFFVPETKGRTFSEIQAALGRKNFGEAEVDNETTDLDKEKI